MRGTISLFKGGDLVNKQIIFIAGVHGVGKTTFCDELKQKLELPSYTASKLIKAFNASLDFPDKKIKEIDTNQDALLSSINQNVKEQRFLLDGHFVLYNENGKVQKIPSKTFKNLNPSSIILLTEDPQTIYKRLELRGKNSLSINEITLLQNSEISYAKEVSTLLSTKLHIIENNTQKNDFLKMEVNYFE